MKYCLAILSGLLAGLSYPTRFGDWTLPDLGPLAFVAWVPLFFALKNQRPKLIFQLVLLACGVHYLLSQYWLYNALHTFGKLSPALSILAMLILVAILSAYLSLAFNLSEWVRKQTGLPLIIIRPIFWIGVEYLRNHFPFQGYPWSQVGYSQGGFLTFIQSADLFGVYVSTYLIVLVNEALFFGIEKFHLKQKQKFYATLIPVLIIFLTNLAYGYYRLVSLQPKPQSQAVGKSLNVGVVQGNIPQDQKWDRRYAHKILKTYTQSSHDLEQKGADLILWPEASLPYSIAYDRESLPSTFALQNSSLLMGAITYPKDYRGPRRQRPAYNSAVLINAEGKILDYYHKKHLVPFGEYVPYAKILFFIKKLTAEVGRLQEGASYRPIKANGDSLGILICYEDIFPEIARIMVSRGAQALINLTNDAWYGHSSAAYQHQVFSQFRSIETRRALVRATNTGISSLIDRRGAIRWQSGLFTRGDFLSELPLNSGLTFYVRWGDKFPQACLVFGAGFLVFAWRRGKLTRGRG